MVCFSVNNFKLGQNIAKAAVKNILYKTRKSAIGISADDGNLIRLMDPLSHVFIAVFDYAFSRCLMPAGKAPDAGADSTVIRNNVPAVIVLPKRFPFGFI